MCALKKPTGTPATAPAASAPQPVLLLQLCICPSCDNTPAAHLERHVCPEEADRHASHAHDACKILGPGKAVLIAGRLQEGLTLCGIII
jgi:hypothetical protein